MPDQQAKIVKEIPCDLETMELSVEIEKNTLHHFIFTAPVRHS